MKSTKLYAAIQAKNVSQVERILQAEPAVLKKRSKEKYNFLHAAAIVGSVNICQLIMQAEATHRKVLDLGQSFSEAESDDMKTPLDCATWHSHIDVVRMFLNSSNRSFEELHKTRLHAADNCQSEQIWDLLLENAPLDFFVSETSARYIARAAGAGNIFTVQYFISRGLNIHQANVFTLFSLLHDAAMRDHLNMVKLLLSLGLDVNALCRETESPLHVAARLGSKEMVRYLLTQNANGYLVDSQQRPAYELGCFTVFWEAGFPAYPSETTRIEVSFADVLFLNEMDGDTTRTKVLHRALFQSSEYKIFSVKAEKKMKKVDPTTFYRTVCTNVGILKHSIRQRVFLDAISAGNLDLAVIMCQHYQDQQYDDFSSLPFINFMDPKSDWGEIIETTLYSLLRSKLLPSFKAIAFASRWNIDEALFHQINKKDWSDEKVTFLHEVVSGRFSLTSDGTYCQWNQYSSYEVEKIVLPTIKFLVTEIGADVNGNTSDCHVKPLYEAVRAAAPLSVIKLLLALGADVNGRNWKGGGTALHACCTHIHSWGGDVTRLIETAELLLQAGADQDCQDDKGHSPKDILIAIAFADIFRGRLDSGDQRMRDRILVLMNRYSTAAEVQKYSEEKNDVRKEYRK